MEVILLVLFLQIAGGTQIFPEGNSSFVAFNDGEIAIYSNGTAGVSEVLGIPLEEESTLIPEVPTIIDLKLVDASVLRQFDIESDYVVLKHHLNETVAGIGFNNQILRTLEEFFSGHISRVDCGRQWFATDLYYKYLFIGAFCTEYMGGDGPEKNLKKNSGKCGFAIAETGYGTLTTLNPTNCNNLVFCRAYYGERRVKVLTDYKGLGHFQGTPEDCRCSLSKYLEDDGTCSQFSPQSKHTREIWTEGNRYTGVSERVAYRYRMPIYSNGVKEVRVPRPPYTMECGEDSVVDLSDEVWSTYKQLIDEGFTDFLLALGTTAVSHNADICTSASILDLRQKIAQARANRLWTRIHKK